MAYISYEIATQLFLQDSMNLLDQKAFLKNVTGFPSYTDDKLNMQIHTLYKKGNTLKE